MPEMARKTRSDKKAPAAKMTRHLTVKLRPDSRRVLADQAKRAGYESTAQYLRAMAEKDRQRLGLAPYPYNDPPKTAPESSQNH